MTKQHYRMLKKARQQYGKIVPIPRRGKKFTTYDGKIYYWFNSIDHSTHAIMEEVENEL
jgi:hypothetical protein